MKPNVAHHFETIGQQREAATLGMWIFLGTEVLFFGGLLTAYTMYRFLYPEAFQEASGHLDIVLGGINTAILLGSSYTMALSVWSLQKRRRRLTLAMLALTAFLGAVFLSIKAYEYHHKHTEHLVPGVAFHYDGSQTEQAELFFWLYFAATGLHALHVLAGVGLLATMAFLVWRRRVTDERYTPLEISGLYWHFVDIVWVFLFPLLYLIGPLG